MFLNGFSGFHVHILIGINVLLVLILLLSLLTDLLYNKVYNWLTYPAMFSGIVFHFILAGTEGILFSLGGLFTGGGIFFLFFLAGGLGAGDVKLMAAVGALKGAYFTIWAICFTGLIGGTMAFGVLIWKKELIGTIKRSIYILAHPIRAHKAPRDGDDAQRVFIPYAAAISLGGLWAFLNF